MTHTPWTVNLSGSVVLADEAPAGDNLIARCYGSHAIEHARLIAAAPETAAERDRLKAINAELLAAAQAGIAYDKAIAECANDPDKMATYHTAQGDDLDALYDDWITKTRAALAKAKEPTP